MFDKISMAAYCYKHPKVGYSDAELSMLGFEGDADAGAVRERCMEILSEYAIKKLEEEQDAAKAGSDTSGS